MVRCNEWNRADQSRTRHPTHRLDTAPPPELIHEPVIKQRGIDLVIELCVSDQGNPSSDPGVVRGTSAAEGVNRRDFEMTDLLLAAFIGTASSKLNFVSRSVWRLDDGPSVGRPRSRLGGRHACRSTARAARLQEWCALTLGCQRWRCMRCATLSPH